MIEAPLLIRPCLPRMTRTELFILFTVGLASVAGTMFVLYATVLKDVLPGALGHMLVASMMALPGAVMIARMMVPGDAATEEAPADLGYRSSMDAVARGHRGRAQNLSPDHGAADRDAGAGVAGRPYSGACCRIWRARP